MSGLFAYYRTSLGGGSFTNDSQWLVLILYYRLQMLSIQEEQAIKLVLSAPRLSTYEVETKAMPNLSGAIALYTWNAQVSAALMFPMHICEIAIRNAVSDAVEAVYGRDWPLSPGFRASLTNPPPPTYSPLRDLIDTANRQPSVGKVIAELKFKFWETMFTGRFDVRLWNVHLNSVMPHLPVGLNVQQARALIHKDLEKLRGLRNRIAHHEPIFTRNLMDDFRSLKDLIGFRCSHTVVWMENNENASGLINHRPP